MSIFLIRHGETALNAARVLQPAATPLNERGLAQAGALARRLAPLGVARILASDLPRALRTAELIAAATGAPIETTSLLHERNFGDLRGLAYDSLAVDPRTADDAAPGGESRAEFEQRVDEAFDCILQHRAATEGNLAVVSHGLVIGVVLARHASLPAGTTAPEHLGNTSLSVLADEPPHGVSLLNCTIHLDSAARDDAGALSGG